MLSSDLPAFRAACDAAPNDAAPRLILADWLDERLDPRGTVLRLGHALRQQVGNVAFPDQADAFWTESPGWEAVQRPIERLIEESPPDGALRARYGGLLRGDVPLDPERLKATLRLQYDLQVQRLASLGLLEEDEGTSEPFLTAIDGTRYPLPAFADVLARVQAPQLQAKLSQGFDTLLLVPFGVDLKRLLAAWGDGLRRHVGAVPALHHLDRRHPVWVWEQYSREPLVYQPWRFADDYAGRTKEQLLAEGRAWDVLLVEGRTELPREGEGRAIGGRPQLECGRTPTEYLASMPEGEVGLTPEAYVVRFLDALQRSGTLLDAQMGTYLLGVYLPSSCGVPYAYWYPGQGQACLLGGDPEYRYDNVGARVAVRVL